MCQWCSEASVSWIAESAVITGTIMDLLLHNRPGSVLWVVAGGNRSRLNRPHLQRGACWRKSIQYLCPLHADYNMLSVLWETAALCTRAAVERSERQGFLKELLIITDAWLFMVIIDVLYMQHNQRVTRSWQICRFVLSVNSYLVIIDLSLVLFWHVFFHIIDRSCVF